MMLFGLSFLTMSPWARCCHLFIRRLSDEMESGSQAILQEKAKKKKDKKPPLQRSFPQGHLRGIQHGKYFHEGNRLYESEFFELRFFKEALCYLHGFPTGR